jgi:hypothetical protein
LFGLSYISFYAIPEVIVNHSEKASFGKETWIIDCDKESSLVEKHFSYKLGTRTGNVAGVEVF